MINTHKESTNISMVTKYFTNLTFNRKMKNDLSKDSLCAIVSGIIK